MQPPVDIILQKRPFRKLLLLGTVVGAMSFLGPAYAEVVWNFGGPGGVHNLGLGPVTFTGSDGTTTVSVGSITEPGDAINAVDLVQKNLGGNEVGLGLANGGGDTEVTPGNILQIDISNIPVAARSDLSFQAGSTTGGDAWQLTAGDFDDIEGGNPVASCNSATETTCNDLITINAGSFTVLSFTATAGDVLLRELDAVPLPGALWLFGTGLAGLGFVSRRRSSKQVSAL